MAASSDQSPNTSRAILLIVGVLVLSALGYFGYSYFTVRAENSEGQTMINKLQTEIEELEEEVLNLTTEFQDTVKTLEDKSARLVETSGELESLQKKLAISKRDNRNSLARIKKLESKMSEMQNLIEQYEKELEFLRSQNSLLTTQVDSLQSLGQILLEENTRLETSNQETMTELERTRKVGGILRTTSYQYFAVNKKGKEKEGETMKRSGLNGNKVCFRILENLVTDPGEKEVFMVIETPGGSILTNQAGGYGGIFTYNGAEKTYSASTTFKYANREQDLCVMFRAEEAYKYEKGIYYVTFYCDGARVGQGNFEVK
ncbi:hypothetical protein [Pontibacter sp. G13]|uniref:hypothetical protein n=1 Tax=Pontibacter sp. G13 TaxID=3074898 RepID=UPI00288B5142|nr:hypothetical protein [Pontibacter sp. G13]WNJ20814.1 hypothetical protein RJD25_10050 [Pontibacter sp. G13]